MTKPRFWYEKPEHAERYSLQQAHGDPGAQVEFMGVPFRVFRNGDGTVRVFDQMGQELSGCTAAALVAQLQERGR